ncbi:MAG TPA: KH domain-containing protein [Smithella sp.]|nr:KH domain-containing protein [Smithella sp.]
MKEFMKYIVQSLVDHPDKVEVNELIGEKAYVIEVRVAKEDLGQVIGKQGKTAQSIRTLLSAVSSKMHKRALLEIIE